MREKITIVLKCEQLPGLFGTFQQTVKDIGKVLKPLDILVLDGGIAYEDIYDVKIFKKDGTEVTPENWK